MRILIAADGTRTDTDQPAPPLSYRVKRQVASSGHQKPLDVYTNKRPVQKGQPK
jgi:hypothetical protein